MKKSRPFGVNKIVYCIVVVFIFSVVVFSCYNFYQSFVGIPKNSPNGKVLITVEKGENISIVADTLFKKQAIISTSGFLWQEKLHPVSPLQTGEYSILVPSNPEQILKQIDDQTKQKTKDLQEQTKVKTAKVTLIEGDDLDDMAVKLEKSGIIQATEFRDFAMNPANFSTAEYVFLPEPLNCKYGDMRSCVKYYPEGYLYPDTYTFVLPTTAGDVYKKLLNNFQKKVWNNVSKQTNSADFYKSLTLASVLEKETGRTKGVTNSNRAELGDERRGVARVFLNRIASGMKWQSNPTVEYGQPYKLCESTFVREGCRYLNDGVFEHLYNTYQIASYPIGPITNPQYDNILATLNPSQDSNLFFVADLTGKTYFASNDNEFNQIIEKVKEINSGL